MAGTLLDELRSRDDAALALLLRTRPDLASPLPANLLDLAKRASTRGSVLRALDGLDRGALQVLDGLLALREPSPATELAAVLETVVDELRGPLDRLRANALAWGDDSALTCLATMREIAGRYPAGLGPPLRLLLPHQPADVLACVVTTLGGRSTTAARDATAVAKILTTPARLAAVVAALPPDAVGLLETTLWDAPVVPVAADGAEHLLERGLLVDVGGGLGVVPLEVGRDLRGGTVRDLALTPPPLEHVAQPADLVDRIGAGAAATFVDHVDRVLAAWSDRPPEALRSGGLSVRSLGAVATLLGVEAVAATLVVEVAFAAGLVGTSDDAVPVWLPSTEYDRWRERSVAHRWVVLALAWLTTTRVPGLAGTRDERDKRIAPLGPEADRAAAPAMRADLLRLAATTAPGQSATVQSLGARLDWAAPRRGGALHDDLVGWTLAELPVLGLTGVGGITTFARGLVDDTADPVLALDRWLPAPVDHVLLQADLTAVAPGPLLSHVAQELGVVAEVESTGGATVFRFTPASVQRAFDAGQAAEDVHDFLAKVSRTPVPQPLTYLVDEVARRHGRVRVSAVAAIVRVDDPATADLLLQDPRLGALALRRLGPTVLGSRRAPQQVVDALRDSGHAAVAEGAEGELVLRERTDRRAPAYRTARRSLASTPSATGLEAVVRALRVGERARASRPVEGDPAGRRVPSRRPTETLALLTETAATARTVWIGYVDNNGATTERLVDPLRVQGGWLTAYDHVRDAVRTFAVHRITGVAPLDPAPAPAGGADA